MIKVELDIPGCALIASYKTGVLYEGQCGGNACYHKTMEGFFIPLCFDDENLEDQYSEFDCGTLCWNSGGRILTKDEIEKYNSFFSRFTPYGGASDITVDESRLSESTEAWMHVKFKFCGIDWEGVFFGINCD